MAVAARVQHMRQGAFDATIGLEVDVHGNSTRTDPLARRKIGAFLRFGIRTNPNPRAVREGATQAAEPWLLDGTCDAFLDVSVWSFLSFWHQTVSR